MLKSSSMLVGELFASLWVSAKLSADFERKHVETLVAMWSCPIIQVWDFSVLQKCCCTVFRWRGAGNRPCTGDVLKVSPYSILLVFTSVLPELIPTLGFHRVSTDVCLLTVMFWNNLRPKEEYPCTVQISIRSEPFESKRPTGCPITPSFVGCPSVRVCWMLLWDYVQVMWLKRGALAELMLYPHCTPTGSTWCQFFPWWGQTLDWGCVCQASYFSLLWWGALVLGDLHSSSSNFKSIIYLCQYSPLDSHCIQWVMIHFFYYFYPWFVQIQLEFLSS